MAPLAAYLTLLFCSPLVAFLVHILASRFNLFCRAGIPSQLVTVMAILVAYPFMAAGGWFILIEDLSSGAERAGAFLYGLFIYANLSYAYFHLYNMSETARRIRILYELKTQGELSREAIDSRYPADSQLHVRLERLVATGQLELKQGRYRIRHGFLWMAARVILGWGEVIGFKHLRP